MQHQWNNGGGNLPVSSQQPDGSMYIDGLPQNIPITPNIQPQTELQNQLAVMCTGYLLLHLQNNATQNQIRTFTFNFLSRNAYQNQDFSELLTLTIEYAEVLVAGYNTEPEKAANGAA